MKQSSSVCNAEVIVTGSVPKLRLRKICRQFFPMTEHNVASRTSSNCLTLRIQSGCYLVILLLLLKKVPVACDVAWTNHRAWYGNIWWDTDNLIKAVEEQLRYVVSCQHFSTQLVDEWIACCIRLTRDSDSSLRFSTCFNWRLKWMINHEHCSLAFD